MIIATAFWWYGSSTAKLVYEQNRNTAQLMLQEHMVATHLGADKIQLTRPGSVPASPEEVNNERQWIESQKKTVQQARGEGQVDLVARASRSGAPRDQDEAAICKKFLSDPAQPSKPDEPKTTEYKELIDEHEYRYFEPIRAQDTCLTMCHAPPPRRLGHRRHGSGRRFAGRRRLLAGHANSSRTT